jgi:hypothetical protein
VTSDTAIGIAACESYVTIQGGPIMGTSKPVTFGLAAVISVAVGVLISQHNQLVTQAEQLAANSYQIQVQQRQLHAQAERLQAQADHLSAADVSKQRDVQLAQTELPDVVVSAPRSSGQAR